MISTDLLPVVYLGPSLPRDEAEGLVAAEFRPPIRRGDLGEVGPGRPVLIVDGEFDQSFPVSPKEILARLDAGETVIGAASMGALRAAELWPMGMIGVGRIYEAYRSGAIEGDDEVALAFCPIGGGPLTVPLVHVRFWLDRAAAEGRIGPIDRRRLLRRAQQVFYAERTPGRMARLVAETLGPEAADRLGGTDPGQIPDAKAVDARAALSLLASAHRATSTPQGART